MSNSGKKTPVSNSESSPVKESTTSRRSFVQGSSSALAAVAVVGGGMSLGAAEVLASPNILRIRKVPRALEAAKVRKRAALLQKLQSLRLPNQMTNGDEERYKSQNYYASFTKTLPHNAYGEVDPKAFRQLVKAMTTERDEDFAAIPLAPNAKILLANPQGGIRIPLAGSDGYATRIAPAPTMRSALTAAEMGEVYWLALTRDVPFSEYGDDSLIDKALGDLNKFSKRIGPKKGGKITAETLFRGSTAGDLNGPYVSQFLWANVPYGPSTIEQRYIDPTAGVDYMTSRANWLNIQRGGAPAESLSLTGAKRYIYNNRTLGEYVHTDVSFQAFMNAALILLSYGRPALAATNPYRNRIANQGGFTSFGGPFILDLVTRAANLSLAGAWFQKWSVHRKLRPEAFGGRVHFKMTENRNYEINKDILNSKALDLVYSKYGTYFLPMAFTEGSPTHPAYPAGHGTISGACTTILKACFDESFLIPNPVEASIDGSELVSYNDAPLTVGGELNKLANNISLGRDAAGVHYRSDGEEGIRSGEQQAIALLQDVSLTLNESFEGFSLTKFDGTRIRIVKGAVRRA